MEELLHKLGVDWRLLIAQIVNFLILFFLLRRYLYQPVLKLLRDRRRLIEKGVKDAEGAEARLKDIEQERQEMLHRADAERRGLLEAAAAEIESLRKQRIQAAEEEARAVIDRASGEAERVRAELLAEVRREIGDLVLAISQKVTAKRLPKSVHDDLMNAAIKELKEAKL